MKTVIAVIITALLTAAVVAQQAGQSQQPQQVEQVKQLQQPQQVMQAEKVIEQPVEAVDTASKNQPAEVPEPAWLTRLTWYSTSTIALASLLATVFAVLIAVSGIFISIYTWRYGGKAQHILFKTQELLKDDTKRKTELDTITAEIAARHPEKARTAVRASEEIDDPTGRAIAEAIKFQTNKQYDKARERWQAIADLAEGRDNETAARAYFSAAWLIQEYDNRYKTKDKKTLNNVMSLYDQTLKIKPDFAEAYSNRGITRSKMGDYEDAIRDYDLALKIKPDFAEALNNRGIAKSELGNYEDAIQDYEQALKIMPDYVEAYSNRGYAKLKLDNHKDAIEDFNLALQIRPYDAKAYDNRGIAKSKLGNYKDAIEDFNLAIAIKPDYAEALNNRGNAKLQLGDYEGAKEDIKKAMEIEPDNEAIKQSLAEIEERQRNNR